MALVAPPMDPSITEHSIALPSCPGRMFYLANGPVDGPLVIFVHGWPELSISWRHQLSCLGALGFRAIAPDMRGYGRSYIPAKHEEVEFRYNVGDLLCLLDALKGPQAKAVFIGHDWGGPIVWALAQHHPEKCHGVGGLVVPAFPPTPQGAPTTVDIWRSLDDALQWDYQVHHNDNTEASHAELDADIRTAMTACFQATYERPPPRMWNKHVSMFDQVKRFKERKQGDELNSWFPKGLKAVTPHIKRDERMVTEADLNRYIESIERSGGFRVPNFYYLNHKADAAYMRGVKNGGRLGIPCLMITAEFDVVCTPAISTHMDQLCTNLTRGHVYCGHWAQQEQPREVNAIITRWLSEIGVWPVPGKSDTQRLLSKM